MSVNIEDKKEYISEILKKITELYYIVISLMINVIIKQTKILTLINNDIKVTVIIIDLT
jgi:hypothetical protein